MSRRVLHRVNPGPDPDKERVVGYYRAAGDLVERWFHERPSRTTLYKYLMHGYPVAKGGPYVAIPVFAGLKRPMTTVEAMQRFSRVVKRYEKPVPTTATPPNGD